VPPQSVSYWQFCQLEFCEIAACVRFIGQVIPSGRPLPALLPGAQLSARPPDCTAGRLSEAEAEMSAKCLRGFAVAEPARSELKPSESLRHTMQFPAGTTERVLACVRDGDAKSYLVERMAGAGVESYAGRVLRRAKSSRG
jgi:hypothetical protein